MFLQEKEIGMKNLEVTEGRGQGIYSLALLCLPDSASHRQEVPPWLEIPN